MRSTKMDHFELIVNVDNGTIESPTDSRLTELCDRLTRKSGELTSTTDWPAEQLKLCADYGVFKWFVDERWGGCSWPSADIQHGYVRLAASCLTTTFVITQRSGACRRIAQSDNDPLKDRLLPDLATGKTFATLGISHLTTSRRHLTRPALVARQDSAGWVLNGFSPWVTGGAAADHIVLGAETESGQQILVAAPTDLPGVDVKPGHSLVALSASQTGAVEFRDVLVPEEYVLDGPKENVLVAGKNASTGGLQTSALAIGVARAAVSYVKSEAAQRDELFSNAEALEAQLDDLASNLIDLANGNQVCTNEELRTSANSFALRATQSALVAAKGAGFVKNHPVGRWCREALFFLVWSCPQNVRDANLCEFAGIAE